MDFSEQYHSYDNGKYQPVGDFLAQFKPIFPAGLMAGRVAKKENRTEDEVLAEWELNADVSRTYGTAIHKAIEYWIRSNKFPKHPHLELAVKKFSEKYDRRRS